LAVFSCTPTVLAGLEPPFAFFKQHYPWIRVVYSRRPSAEAARVNNSRHTCCRIYFSKTINPPDGREFSSVA
jgi:hypothetical protein